MTEVALRTVYAEYGKLVEEGNAIEHRLDL